MKSRKKYILQLLALLSLNTVAYAQQLKPCGTTEAMQKLIEQHPEIIQKQQELEAFTSDYVNAIKQGSRSVDSTTVYVIPIVFHVIHEYGAENISDEQIFDAVEVLNRDYRKMNADSSAIIPEFQGIAADCRLEFRLAQKAPSGACTNGIDRIYSHRTRDANDFSKLNKWDRTKYLNVWVVKTIGDENVAGYAYYPSAVDGPLYPYDGILIKHDYIGRIGTSNEYNSRALTHKIGHYLNLSHPWGNTNNPGVACGDDNVDDTPETRGSNLACNLAMSQCNPPVIENVQNYMDYSYCSKMYTRGQRDRMRAALNSTISHRNNLWSAGNLQATGTDVPPATCKPIADFYGNPKMVCDGQSISLHDASWNAAVAVTNWTVTGATNSTSTSPDPNFTFNTHGWQNVTLVASNAMGSDTITKNNYVHVSPATWTDYNGTFTESFEDENVINSKWIVFNPDGNASKWQMANSVGASGSKSFFLNAYSPMSPGNPGIGANDIDYFVTPSFNLWGHTGLKLNFKLSCASYASNADDITEQLRIFVSYNCGQSWSIFKTIEEADLVNAGYWSTFYVPNSANLWNPVSINLSSSFSKPNVRFKFEFESGNFSNNIYIDDINISGVVGMNEPTAELLDLTIQPNPSNGEVTVSYFLPSAQQVKIELYDMVGKHIKQIKNNNESAGNHAVKFDKKREGLESGVYFIKLVTGNNIVTRKLILVE